MQDSSGPYSSRSCSLILSMLAFLASAVLVCQYVNRYPAASKDQSHPVPQNAFCASGPSLPFLPHDEPVELQTLLPCGHTCNGEEY